MTTEVAPKDAGAIIEQLVAYGDLSALTPKQRVEYYQRVCESLGLNPLTRPFGYLKLNGQLRLYAFKDATDQLRRIHGVSVQIVARELVNDVYVVTARATDAHGRTDEAIGAVSVEGLKGDSLANAMMKAESKAKRRVTLSLVGLGWLDESEVDSIPRAETEVVDVATGEIVAPPPKKPAGTPSAEPVPRIEEFSEKTKTVIREISKLREEGKVTPAHLQRFLESQFGMQRLPADTLSSMLERLFAKHQDLDVDTFMTRLFLFLKPPVASPEEGEQ